MTDKDTGGPAFPTPRYERGDMYSLGMTLRDYFAAKAMAGLIASLREGEGFSVQGCEWAYKVADDMIKARQA